MGDPPINIFASTLRNSGGICELSTGVHQDIRLTNCVAPSGKYLLGIRANHILASREYFQGSVPATVELVENLGSEHVLHVTYGNEMIRVMVKPNFAVETNIINVALDTSHIHLFHPNTDEVVLSGREQIAA